MSSGEPTNPPPGPADTDPGVGDPSSTPRPAPSTAAGATSSDPAPAPWPAQAADLVVDVVDRVRDKTTTPVLTIARGIVYGAAIVILAVTAVVLLIVALVRFVDVWLPGEVWSAYLLLGVVFLAGGLFLWATRRPREAD